MEKISTKLLITGREGFIGTHLWRHLSQQGVAIINDSSNINQNKILDVTNLEQLMSINQEVDAVVHLAAKSSVNNALHNPYETYFTNFLGTLNLLEFARLKDVRKFINVSTYVYGEPQYLPVNEKHPVNPHSLYHRSKLIAEQICESYSYDFGIDIVTLRPFYIYGPDCRPYSFIPSVIRQIEKNGKVLLSGNQTRRDFLFIDDFVKLVEAILNNFPTGYNVYNVGYGRSYPLKEVSHLLAKLLNKKIAIDYDDRMRPGDVINMIADISKVSNEFNWRPYTSLEKGLELTINNSSLSPIIK